MPKKRFKLSNNLKFYMVKKKWEVILMPFSPKKVLEYTEMIEDDLAKALFSFLYLTGARISEATLFKPIDILHEDKDKVKLVITTLKRRKPKKRISVIPINPKYAKCYEDKHWEIVSSYIRQFSPSEKVFARWGNMSEYLKRHVPELEGAGATLQGERIVYTKPFNPHFLRHCRNSHLVEVYHASSHELKAFNDWSNTNPAEVYVHVQNVEVIFFGKQIFSKV